MALRERLEADGEATFANGARIERVVQTHLVVHGPYGARTTVGDESNLELAYELALYGPRKIAQPKGDPTMFGDDAPF